MKRDLLRKLVALSLVCGVSNVWAQATMDSLDQQADQSQGQYQPMNLEHIDKEALTKILVRDYVLLRSAFVNDVKEMEARWTVGGQLQEMSSPSVYQAFLEKTAKRALNEIKTKGLTRSVRIMSIEGLSPDLWQVEYETRDMYADSTTPQIKYWTATLRVSYRKKTVEYGKSPNNPIGFTVAAYSLSLNKGR